MSNPLKCALFEGEITIRHAGVRRPAAVTFEREGEENGKPVVHLDLDGGAIGFSLSALSAAALGVALIAAAGAATEPEVQG